ncbi:MAG: hypothetical protein EPO13_08460 [Actinomycetota bacterium]|nr:MAG: hypothetical protein EPO13_08460 [Actinomycetota bacterium]
MDLPLDPRDAPTPLDRPGRAGVGTTGVTRVASHADGLPARDQLRRELARLGAVSAESLAPLVAVRGAGPRALALVHEEPVDARPWAAASSALTARQRRQVLADVEAAVRALHAAGLAHGDVDDVTVLVTVAGRGVLTATGTRWGVDPKPVAAQDLAAVRELRAAIDDTIDDASVEIIDQVADGAGAGSATSGARISASIPAESAAPAEGSVKAPTGAPPGPAAARPSGAPAAAGTATPAPVAETGAVAVLRTRRHRPASRSGPGPSRLTVAVLAAAVLLPAAAAALWAWNLRPADRVVAHSFDDVTIPAGIAPPVAAPVTGVPAAFEPATVAWVDVLAEIDRAREAAWRSADEGALEGADVPGSAAWVADADAVRTLAANGWRAPGVTTTVSEVAVVSGTAASVVLRVNDVRAAYDVIDRAGAVVGHHPASGPRSWLVSLTRTDQGWRTSAVAAG